MKFFIENVIVPDNLSDEAKNILSLILKKSALERISIDESKKHLFFKNLDWELLEKKEIKIP